MTCATMNCLKKNWNRKQRDKSIFWTVCLRGTAPQYLVNCCHPTSDVASRQRRLRSSSRHHLVVPRHRRSTLGRRAFSVAGPMASRPSRPVAQCRQFQENAKDAPVSECTWTLSALEALRNALYII